MSMYSTNEVKKMIEEGKKLILAGDENILKNLPAGHWIGGTIPYFMTEKGGKLDTEQIFVNEIPSYSKKIVIKSYGEDNISNIFEEAPDNGFTMIILPAASPIHLSFALNAPNYKSFAAHPLIGWISGVHVNNIGKTSAKVFYGEKVKMLDNNAVAMHVELPVKKYAEIKIVNIFKQGSGDVITFNENSFNVKDANINGNKTNFLDYIKKNKIDIKLPLVADYNGAMINISFQELDEANKKVTFYAPVFKGVEYKLAAPVGDYVKEFTSHLPKDDSENIFFSCNCILNYLYSELEGKSTRGVTGPITFGEIAYQLLNQTMAYVTINDAV